MRQRELGLTEASLFVASRLGYGCQVNSMLADVEIDVDRLRDAVLLVQKQHPMLSGVIVSHAGRPSIRCLDRPVDLLETTTVETASIDLEMLEEIVDSSLPADRPPWKLLFHQAASGPHLFTIHSNHLLGDGRAMLGVLGAILNAATGRSSMVDRHALPPSIESVMCPGMGLTECVIGGGPMRTTPCTAWVPEHPSPGGRAARTMFARDTIKDEMAQRFFERCRRERIRVTGLLAVVSGRAVLDVLPPRTRTDVMPMDILFDGFGNADRDPCCVAIHRVMAMLPIEVLRIDEVGAAARRIQRIISMELDRGLALPDTLDAASFPVAVEHYMRSTVHACPISVSNLGVAPLPTCGGVCDVHGHVAKGGGPGRILLESITTPSGWHLDWSWDDSAFEEADVSRVRAFVVAQLESGWI